MGLADHHVGYKVLTRDGGIQKMNWGMVTNAQPLEKLDLDHQSLMQIEDWSPALKTMDYVQLENLKYWMTTSEEPSSLDDLPPLPPPIIEAPASIALPGDWTASDIGNALTGGQIISDSTWTIYGGGSDIWTDHDQFSYIWMPVSGDFAISATVDDLVMTNT